MHGREPRCSARDHLGLKSHLGAHLDGRAGHLSAAHSEVDITGEEPTAVDVAREQQRSADDGLLHVGVATVLARRDGPHAFVLRRAIDPAEIRRQGVDRLRQQHRTPCSGQAFSRFSHLSSSGLSGSTPTVPMNAFIGTAIPGISFERASRRFSSQWTI